MKKQIIKDERVLAQKIKIGSEAFQILFYGLLASILIQQYMFNAPFSQYAVELIFFISSSVYILVRNLMVGNSIFSSVKNKQQLIVVNSLTCGLTITVISTVLNYIKLGDLFRRNIGNTVFVSAITFVCATIFAFVLFELLYIENKKKQERIEAMLNNDENIIE